MMEEMYLAWKQDMQRRDYASLHELRCVAIANSKELFLDFINGFITIDELYRIYWGLQLR